MIDLSNDLSLLPDLSPPRFRAGDKKVLSFTFPAVLLICSALFAFLEDLLSKSANVSKEIKILVTQMKA
jgi:hypothetical protein